MRREIEVPFQISFRFTFMNRLRPQPPLPLQPVLPWPLEEVNPLYRCIRKKCRWWMSSNFGPRMCEFILPLAWFVLFCSSLWVSLLLLCTSARPKEPRLMIQKIGTLTKLTSLKMELRITPTRISTLGLIHCLGKTKYKTLSFPSSSSPQYHNNFLFQDH